MATQLFLRQAGISDPSQRNGIGLFEDPGFMESGTYVVSAAALSTSRGAGVQSQSVVTQTTAPNFLWGLTCISPPVSAAVTISGTITFNIWGRELADTANRGFTVRLYRYRDSDGSLTLIVNSDKGTELPTSSAAQNWTAAPTSTALAKGDRLVLWVGTEERGGSTPAGVDVFFNTDAASASVNGDSYMTLTENLSFEGLTEPSGLTLYLTDTSSEVDPGAGFVARKMLTTRGAGVASAVFLRTGTTWPTAGHQWTVTSGGSDKIEWYSNRLAAFTLTGRVKVNLRGLMDAFGGVHRCAMRAELAIVDEDGTGAVIVGNALCMLGSDQAVLATSEFPDTAVLYLPDTTFDGGKRLRLRVYADDGFVETDEGLGGTGTATLRYAGTTGGASGDAFITLEQSPADFSEPEPPTPVTMAYRIQPTRVF